MNKILLFALISFCGIVVNAQTFQYSRGWTNGKRSNLVVTDMPPPSRQMIQNSMPQVLTINDLNNRERLIQHIIKNPCDLRMALLSHNIQLNDDHMSPTANEIDDDVVDRFKRDLMNH
ncbi:CLUMA_CG002480, isoform A [Clunio marinus]|uniref:Pro-corazonin n=1 Tax=Clunio marinus TaxID=568069 RepID=A0A1J1HLB8_9DIPT|nr:CLUMA_CG002480, isoform A [Clunio marinus]